MYRLACASCDTTPPAGTRSHERCPHCRGPLSRELRCAWCLGWSEGSRCARCQTPLFEPHDFGPARMLRTGGVDKYALYDRVRALTRNEHASLAATFDTELAALSELRARVAAADAGLLWAGHAEALEAQLLEQLPRHGRAATVPAELRVLEALARLYAGELSREVLGLAYAALGQRGSPLAVEAALALVRAALVEGLYLEDRGLHEVLASAHEVLGPDADGRTPLGLWLAVAEVYARRVSRDDPRVASPLRAALGHADEDLRLAAALILDDAGALEPFLRHPRADWAALARRALTRSGSSAALHLLTDGDPEAREEVLRALRAPLRGPWWTAVIQVVARDARLRERALELIRREPFVGLPDEARLELWSGLRAWASQLSTHEILGLLSWATEPVEPRTPAPPLDDARVRPVVDVATQALLRHPAEAREALARDDHHALVRWLHVAGADEIGRVLDAWGPSGALVEHALELHGRLNGYDRPPELRAWAPVLAWLERHGEAVAPAIGAALARHQGLSGREHIVASLWACFVASPDTRRAVMTAGASLRHELKEARRAAELDGELSSAHPARLFRVLVDADPLDGPHLVRELTDALPERGHPELAELVREVGRYTAAHLHTRPCTALWALASVASPVANRFRVHPHEPALRRATEVLEDVWAELVAPLAQVAPLDEREARYDHLVEQVEVELRLITERYRALAEEEARARAREEDEARRVWERAERERQAREAELAAARAAGARLLAEAEAALAAEDRARAALDIEPRLPVSGLDEEVLLAGTALPTLLSYARLMKAMGGGGVDVLALFRVLGMSIEAWTSTATAWGALLSARPAVALRFGELLMATWVPRGREVFQDH